MFRFKPEAADGDRGTSVAQSDAFTERLRAEMDETNVVVDDDDDANDAELDVADAPRPGVGVQSPSATISPPELLPKAIPMMPATARSPESSPRPESIDLETEAGKMMSSPSGLPPPRRGVSMSGVVGDDPDASLISVLLPTASGKTTPGRAFRELGRLFVVTYSRRREDYVTYSCGIPREGL
jgi:hypothetical protein